MPRTYVDNASNRSLGRVGMPVGSMVVSGGSGGGSYGGGSYSSYSSSSGYDASSSATREYSSPRGYVDNASNRSLGRAGMPFGSMVVSGGSSGGSGGGSNGGGSYSSYSSSSSSSSSGYGATSSATREYSSPRSYVDNASNRSLGRVGMPVGSMVVSRGSGSGSNGGNYSSHKASSSSSRYGYGATSSATSEYSSPRAYVDNAYNRSVGRVSMPTGSMVISKRSSAGSASSSGYGSNDTFSATDSHSNSGVYVDNAYNRKAGRVGLSYGTAVISKGSSGNSSGSTSSRPEKYADNAYNRQLGRAGELKGSMPVSKGSSPSARTSTKTDVKKEDGKPHDIAKFKSYTQNQRVRVYVDNPMNRKLDRVGKLLGTCVVSKTGKKMSLQKYEDNAFNRKNNRVGKPRGSLPIPRVSKNTEKIRDIINEMKNSQHDFGQDYLSYDEAILDQAAAFINRQIEEREWREKNRMFNIQTSKVLLADYTGTQIYFEEIELGRKIGQGGFGDVYFATWNGSVVAVKMLKVQRVSKKRLKDFSKEVKAFCNLDHPNIVKFIGACLTTPNLCIIMEYMQTSLYEALHMDRDIDFADDERLDIIQQTCDGMMYLHHNGIAHCDLKSQNILLNYKAGKLCEAKITDFGLSMMKSNTETSAHTYEKVCNVGTPRYSAPEILRGEMMTVKSMMMADIYSFGLVIFEVMYEEEPYYDLSYAQLRKQVGKKGLSPDIPDIAVNASVEYIMKKCWYFNPEDRPEIRAVARLIKRQRELYMEE